MKPWLVLVTLFSLLVPASAQALPTLLIADQSGLRPIAIFEGDKFFAPSQDTERQALLGQAILKESPELPLFYNGQQATSFKLESFQPTPPRCSGSGYWLGQSLDPLLRPMLAFSPDFPGPRKYVGTYPTERFDSLAIELSRKAYQRQKVPAAQLKYLSVKRVEPFTLMNGARVMVSVESEIKSPGKECPEYQLLLLIEKVGRRYLSVLERLSHNTKACTRFQFLSTFATGSTVDKLALRGSNSEAAWYDIYQAQYLGGLKQVYHGGGHSCGGREN